MKKLFITILCVTILYSCKSCKTKKEVSNHTIQNQDTTTQISESANIKFKGMLAEELFLTEPCGSINNAITFKFTINQIIEGHYENKEIFIIQPCPELKGKDFFTENIEYIIEASLENKSNLNFQIYNYYKNSKLPQYWALSIVKVINK